MESRNCSEGYETKLRNNPRVRLKHRLCRAFDLLNAEKEPEKSGENADYSVTTLFSEDAHNAGNSVHGGLGTSHGLDDTYFRIFHLAFGFNFLS